MTGYGDRILFTGPNTAIVFRDPWGFPVMEPIRLYPWTAYEEIDNRVYRRGSEEWLKQRIGQERRKGLQFVGDRLDELCEDYGMDPNHTWRYPRADEEERRRMKMERAFRADARISLAMQDPSAFVKVTTI